MVQKNLLHPWFSTFLGEWYTVFGRGRKTSTFFWKISPVQCCMKPCKTGSVGMHEEIAVHTTRSSVAAGSNLIRKSQMPGGAGKGRARKHV